MQITRVYATPDGVSHFEDIDVPLAEAGAIGWLSRPEEARHIVFRVTAPDYDYDWHPAPARQYIVLLDGEIEIEVGDGATRRFRGGDVLLVEDTAGRGHRTRTVDGKRRRSIFVTLPERASPEGAEIDIIQQASEASFPASDAPGWTGTAAT